MCRKCEEEVGCSETGFADLDLLAAVLRNGLKPDEEE